VFDIRLTYLDVNIMDAPPRSVSEFHRFLCEGGRQTVLQYKRAVESSPPQVYSLPSQNLKQTHRFQFPLQPSSSEPALQSLASPRMTSREAIARGDEALLSQLGYKQEFKRAFTPFEVRPLHLSQMPVNSRDSIARETLIGVRGVLQHYWPPPVHCVCLILFTIELQ